MNLRWLRVRLLVTVLGLVASGYAAAQEPLEQAIGAWLANDDATAFPALSALAAAGDERAMLFLGAIEERSLGSVYLTGLDRETRNRMLRAPGGLSGKSWLLRVTSDRHLASALLAARGGDPRPLLVLGEPYAASEAILASFNSAPWSLASVVRQTPVPETLRHLVWVGADMGLSLEVTGLTLSPDQQAELRAVLAEATDPEWRGSLQLALFQSMQQPSSNLPTAPRVMVLAGQILRHGEFDLRAGADMPEVTDAERTASVAMARAILATAAEVAPVRELCDKACPADPDACSITVWSLTGAGMTLGAFHTPLDSLVSQSTYLSSARYRADLRRAAKPPPPGADACGSQLMSGD